MSNRILLVLLRCKKGLPINKKLANINGKLDNLKQIQNVKKIELDKISKKIDTFENKYSIISQSNNFILLDNLYPILRTGSYSEGGDIYKLCNTSKIFYKRPNDDKTILKCKVHLYMIYQKN